MKTPPHDGPFPRNIGRPATQALAVAGYTELRQLHGVAYAELKRLHGMGPVALSRLQDALEARGLSLGSPPARNAPADGP